MAAKPKLRILAGLVGILGLSCLDAGPGGFQLDRATRAGERLWVLEVTAPGQDSYQVDRWVAGPLIRALARDGRIDVAAMLSECERARVLLRARVHLSSVDILTEIIGSLKLPDATIRPNLSPAGPGGWPGGRAVSVVRVTGRSIEELHERLKCVEIRLAGSGPVGRTPSYTGFIRSQLDQAMLAVAGVRPADIYRRLRRARADEVERMVIGSRGGEEFPLTSLARFSSAYVPDRIIRLDGNTYAGYLLVDRPVDRPEADYASLRSPAGLSDAEAALLDVLFGSRTTKGT